MESCEKLSRVSILHGAKPFLKHLLLCPGSPSFLVCYVSSLANLKQLYPQRSIVSPRILTLLTLPINYHLYADESQISISTLTYLLSFRHLFPIICWTPFWCFLHISTSKCPNEKIRNLVLSPSVFLLKSLRLHKLGTLKPFLFLPFLHIPKLFIVLNHLSPLFTTAVS